MELIEGSETSANHNRTPGKHPKEYIQHLKYIDHCMYADFAYFSRMLFYAFRTVFTLKRLAFVNILLIFALPLL